MSNQYLHVIGTAGHVDHGKSTLVKALTGIDPDRLAEEKAREMTIDLGFAWLSLDDQEIGIVDVPGHRDFIENMLAGVGSIDLALFVIAADEGVMPQTREHLAILDLLQIDDGVIALTKIDMVDDPDWLELVMLDIDEAVTGTALANAPVIPVSAMTGEGLAELKSALAERLAQKGPSPDFGRPRLSVDRVFSLSGFGTVVTGTLTGGTLSIGDKVEIIPGKRKARVRGLQTHKKKLDTALPGSRVAINLTNVDRDEVKRGEIIAAEGVVAESILLDAVYRQLPDAGEPLKHNKEVKLFVGAAEVLARTRVIGSTAIEPGTEGWLQLALAEPVAVSAGDRFILRRPSPSSTLGGGQILDPHPGRRHRRFRPDVITRFQTLAAGSTQDLILLALRRQQQLSRQELLAQAGVERSEAEDALSSMLEMGSIRQIGGALITEDYWRLQRRELIAQLNAYHTNNPLRLGMLREELRSRLRLDPPLFAALVADLIAGADVIDEGNVLRSANHEVRFTAGQDQRIQTLLDTFQRAGVNTPSVKEAKQAVGDDLYMALVDLGRLKQLNADVVYTREQYQALTGSIISYIRKNGRIDAAQTRDLLQTSRKYAIALLEHLDDIKVTRRVDDARVLHQHS